MNVKYRFFERFPVGLLINPSSIALSCVAFERAEKNLLKASPLISKRELEKTVNSAIAPLSWRN